MNEGAPQTERNRKNQGVYGSMINLAPIPISPPRVVYMDGYTHTSTMRMQQLIHLLT